MRVTIEVGDGQELCYLLDREIDTKRTRRDILAAMPPEQRLRAEAEATPMGVHQIEGRVRQLVAELAIPYQD